jgi:hypothetical protein
MMNALIKWLNVPLSPDEQIIANALVLVIVLFLIWVDPMNHFSGKK